MMQKVVVIFGANGGLGKAVTSAFLSTEAVVVGVSRDISQAEFSETNFHARPADLGTAEAARSLVDGVVSQFGRIDVVVNLVGAFEMGKPVESADAWEKMLTLNFRVALYVFSAALPHMKRQGAGRLIGIGSKTAVEPAALMGPYNVSKAALVSLVRTIARENKNSGITANVVLPGTMDTPANRTAMPDADPKRWVQPADVAQLLLYLASDAAGPMTGAVIPLLGADS
ncbi:MAG: SDR family NAD(P)-dependent oxidoreductase [Acidobacteria bacterium]|nr:SDR family NAD(P)-dependent oxidoreductase [Acidobacteriota bacterium]